MSTRIIIDDDGDETVFISVNEEAIGEVGYGRYGWDGMSEVIKLVEALAETFGIPVSNHQDIV